MWLTWVRYGESLGMETRMRWHITCAIGLQLFCFWNIPDDVIQWKFPALLTLCVCGEFTGHQWILLTKASDAGLWCFLWNAPEKKRLSKHSKLRWFETPSRSLWRHCYVTWYILLLITLYMEKIHESLHIWTEFITGWFASLRILIQ